MLRLVIALVCSVVHVALAQDRATPSYPARPVRVIVPFPAGGSNDVMTRIVAERLTLKWGQPVVIDNRPGAAGNIGAEIVYKSEPDGYTLLSAPPPPLVINPNLYPKLGYDPTRFVPVSVMGAIPNVFLTHPSMPVATVKDAIAYARANPGKLNYASQGSGTTSHLTAELFKSMAGGLNVVNVPYKGTAPALIALVGGQVQIMFDNLGVSMLHVRGGKLKALAVASEKRIAALADIPTMSETLPGFLSIAWFGIVAPPKTPASIAERFAAAVGDGLKEPEAVRRMNEMSAESLGTSPAHMGTFMKQEAERWRNVIRVANVKLE
jgi:tripartite-type tricarboxylate transporter receptor subunit TctC